MTITSVFSRAKSGKASNRANTDTKFRICKASSFSRRLTPKDEKEMRQSHPGGCVLGLRISFVNENEHADEHDPERKYSRRPMHVAGTQQFRPCRMGTSSDRRPLSDCLIRESGALRFFGGFHTACDLRGHLVRSFSPRLNSSVREGRDRNAIIFPPETCPAGFTAADRLFMAYLL